MTTDELTKRIAEAARAGQWPQVQPLFVELKRLMVEQGRPLGSNAAMQIVDALAEGNKLGANLLGSAGVSPLILRVRALAGHKIVDRKALQTAWESLYRLLADPTARVEQQELHDLMLGLRAARVFDLLARTADRAVTRNPTDAVARRLYGQALIDEGQIHAGIEMLESARRLPLVAEAERDEINGLVGRAYKQLYLDHVPAGSPPSVRAQFRVDLERAIEAYALSYDPDRPDRNSSHGVNLVALLQIARQDGHAGIKNPTALEPQELAGRIIDRLELRAAGTADPWLLATLGECYLGNL